MEFGVFMDPAGNGLRMWLLNGKDIKQETQPLMPEQLPRSQLQLIRPMTAVLSHSSIDRAHSGMLQFRAVHQQFPKISRRQQHHK